MKINEIIDPVRSLIEHIRLPEFHAKIERFHQNVETESNNFTILASKKWGVSRKDLYLGMIISWISMLESILLENEFHNSYTYELLQELLQYFDE